MIGGVNLTPKNAWRADGDSNNNDDDDNDDDNVDGNDDGWKIFGESEEDFDSESSE